VWETSHDSHRVTKVWLKSCHSHSMWQRSQLIGMRTVGGKVHSHDSNCIYSVAESNGDSIKFSLSIAEQRAVGFIPAWSLASLHCSPMVLMLLLSCDYLVTCCDHNLWHWWGSKGLIIKQEWKYHKWLLTWFVIWEKSSSREFEQGLDNNKRCC